MTVITVETDDVAAYADFVGRLNKTWQAERINASGSVSVPAQAGEQVGVAYDVSFVDSSADWLAHGTSTIDNKAVAAVIASADTVHTRVDNSLYTALLDAMSSDWLQKFLAGIAPIRTLQSNGIYLSVPTQ